MKNIRFFYLKIFIFLVVKFSVYLNRHVFVMSELGGEVDKASGSQIKDLVPMTDIFSNWSCKEM